MENCETSAIGRALANAGYAPKGKRPSREEMSEAVATPKKTIESIVKETFFSEIERLTNENEMLKAELAKLSKVDEVANESTEHLRSGR